MHLFQGATFKPDKDIPDLQNQVSFDLSVVDCDSRSQLIQVFVVTGASSGLGFAITCHLIKHNAAKIITLSNNEQHAMKAIEQLKSWGDTSRVSWHKCDLRDLRQVDRVAKKLKEAEKRIDGVCITVGNIKQTFADCGGL